MTDDPHEPLRRQRFEALALPHLDAAYNLARWLARNDHDAADVVQDAFLRAYDAFGSLRGDNARPWLLAIVRNTCFSWLERNRPGASHVVFDDALHGGTDPDADPERVALRAEDRARIDRALAGLPIAFREVIVLRELEDLSYREIAQVLDVPIGTVMSRLARARRLMAESLADDDATGA
ncbi:MAG TPA: sigma-70 family RNA polymerase sigma factor [Burkholderiaceae bacterium]|nr:sigma-70 family RNA polymerase sigma factor [Burkholderiaceae bacterium]